MGPGDDVDVIEALRRADGPATPDAAFAARLLDDLASALADVGTADDAGRVEDAGRLGDEDATVVPLPGVAEGWARGSDTGRGWRRRVAITAAVVVVLVGGGFAALTVGGDGGREVRTGGPAVRELADVCASDLPTVEEAVEALDVAMQTSPIPEESLRAAVGRLDAFAARAAAAITDGSVPRVREGIEDARTALSGARTALAGQEPASITTAQSQFFAGRNVMRAALRLAVQSGAIECTTTVL